MTTLATVRHRVGEIVIFEGRCVEVRVSRSGSTFGHEILVDDRSMILGVSA
jgi:hypothetical protein